MGRLRKAVEAAEKRKSIVLGDEDQNGLRYFDSNNEMPLMFSGMDVDITELHSILKRVSQVMTLNVIRNPDVEIATWMASMWTEGLLVGFMLARLPDEPPEGFVDNTKWLESD